MSAVLSAQEIQQYKEQGYLFPKYRLPAPLLDRLTKGIDRLLGTYTDVAQEDLANPHMIPPTEGAHLNPFMETARHAPILDMVQQMLGPDIVLWITRVLCKPPVKGREVPWHQDGEYWPMRPLATCSVWIAVDPVSEANGCMRFIPGSHKQQELYRHHQANRDNLVLNLELEPGEMSLHDVRMIHGSLANTSGQRRAALILRYMPATSHYDRSLVTKRKDNSPFNIFDQPLWLMRGVDRSAKNDFAHGHELWKKRYAGGLALPKGSEG